MGVEDLRLGVWGVYGGRGWGKVKVRQQRLPRLWLWHTPRSLGIVCIV